MPGICLGPVAALRGTSGGNCPPPLHEGNSAWHSLSGENFAPHRHPKTLFLLFRSEFGANVQIMTLFKKKPINFPNKKPKNFRTPTFNYTLGALSVGCSSLNFGLGPPLFEKPKWGSREGLCMTIKHHCDYGE